MKIRNYLILFVLGFCLMTAWQNKNYTAASVVSRANASAGQGTAGCQNADPQMTPCGPSQGCNHGDYNWDQPLGTPGIRIVNNQQDVPCMPIGPEQLPDCQPLFALSHAQ